jgi:ribonuclease HI
VVRHYSKFIVKVFEEAVSVDIIEYRAIIAALEFLNTLNPSNLTRKPVYIYSDSQSSVDEINGRIRINPRHVEFHKKINDLLYPPTVAEADKNSRNRYNIKIVWIPRDKNTAGIYLEKRLGLIKKRFNPIPYWMRVKRRQNMRIGRGYKRKTIRRMLKKKGKAGYNY